jgi:hypothetical protein
MKKSAHKESTASSQGPAELTKLALKAKDNLESAFFLLQQSVDDEAGHNAPL